MGAFLIVVDYFLSNDKENRKYIKKEEKWFEFSKEKKAQILFVGDMMFDRRIREITEKNGGDYIFSCIEDLLKSVDVVVGNLEGPITDNQSVSKYSIIGSPDNYRFTFPTTTASLLSKQNINIVNLGNNHIGNFGIDGFKETLKYLDQSGVGYFGGIKGEESVYRKNVGGINFSFISYNAFGGDDFDLVAKKIRAEDGLGNKVVVFAHWGEEYKEDVGNLRKIAKIFVENGADLIIGSHPHIVLSNENIDGVSVYYSLGNFIFDQYWEESVRNGLIVFVEFNDGLIKEAKYLVEIFKDGKVCLK
jgi:poly-gamma-glutamate synthesis protein (capsule biosynthesis protein)